MAIVAADGETTLRARIAPGAVKIDGLRRPEHARAAVLAGADLVGFIFAPARRRVTPEEARACLDAARDAAGDRTVLGVGVFVDAPAAEVNAVVDAAGLDLVQLHGDEPPDLLAQLTRPTLKAFRPRAGSNPREVEAAFGRYRAVGNAPLVFLLDGYSPHAAGGEGVRADWAVAAEMARHDPVMLAGGLTPGNVAEAIARVRPLAVDVSSGVETDGVKDPAKVAAFVAAAKGAFAAAGTSGH
jgi:phosphoribosylanthranilate isomerase